MLLEDVQQHARPVAAVAHLPQVAQRPLRRAHAPLLFGELVREGDEEAAVALALVRRQREDARQVVLLLRGLLLGKVAHHVVPRGVVLREDVEQEGVHVVVERLVVQEELGEVAQVLAVHLLLAPVHLKHGDVAVAVDLVAGRVQHRVLAQVAHHHVALLEEVERELAKVQLLDVVVLCREGRKVPGVHVVAAQLDHVDVLHLGELLVLAQRVGVKLGVLLVAGVRLVVLPLEVLVLREVDLRQRVVHGGEVHLRETHPLVHAPVESVVMHVILELLRARDLALLDDAHGVVLAVAPEAVHARARVQRQFHLRGVHPLPMERARLLVLLVPAVHPRHIAAGGHHALALA
mmetsp:Transcript_41598/g.106452  ORF Transcript_41598/g.106452 Transcript_41598/m.106452 type:complete len:349 (+) Transcript_41598:700-1746(+)